MKYIKLLFCIFLATSCVKKNPNLSEMYPPYRLIKIFSQKIQPNTHLVLTSYGINHFLPEDYQHVNGIGNFAVSYSLPKTKNDTISLEAARKLAIIVAENLVQTINSDLDVTPDLDIFPFRSDLIEIVIRFKDENNIDLGNGVAYVYCNGGKIKYKGYKISEYRDRYPAVGKHYTIHEESYEEALEIVKKQGAIQLLEPS